MARIQFDTPWSPPEEWLQAVTKKYPLLDIMIKVTEVMLIWDIYAAETAK